MGFALESVYRKLLRFSYSSCDRLVIRGHDRARQAPAGVAWWCRALRPDGPITDSWLACLARRFHEGVKTFAAEHHVPIITAHRNLDKFQTGATYRSKMTTSDGVYLLERIGATRRYRPTAHGLRVAVLLAKLREQLLPPLLAAIHRKRPRSKPRRPLSEPDSTYFRVAQALFDLCDHLALRPAA